MVTLTSNYLDGRLTCIFEVEYLKNAVSWEQSFYRTLGNHTQSVEWYHFQ